MIIRKYCQFHNASPIENAKYILPKIYCHSPIAPEMIDYEIQSSIVLCDSQDLFQEITHRLR